MPAYCRLWKLGHLNELGHRELTLLQKDEEAASGEVAQSAHSVENPGFGSYNIHRSEFKDITPLGRWQRLGGFAREGRRAEVLGSPTAPERAKNGLEL